MKVEITDNEKTTAARDDGEGGMNRWSTEEFQGTETALWDPVMTATGHKFLPSHRIDNITLRGNYNVNYGLW